MPLWPALTHLNLSLLDQRKPHPHKKHCWFFRDVRVTNSEINHILPWDTQFYSKIECSHFKGRFDGGKKHWAQHFQKNHLFLQISKFGIKNVKPFSPLMFQKARKLFLKRKDWKLRRFLITSKLDTRSGVFIISNPSGLYFNNAK